MRSDTMSMLNEFTGEQLLWLAVRSNVNMRAKVTLVIESRARRGLVAGSRSNRAEPARSRLATGYVPATTGLRNADLNLRSRGAFIAFSCSNGRGNATGEIEKPDSLFSARRCTAVHRRD